MAGQAVYRKLAKKFGSGNAHEYLYGDKEKSRLISVDGKIKKDWDYVRFDKVKEQPVAKKPVQYKESKLVLSRLPPEVESKRMKYAAMDYKEIAKLKGKERKEFDAVSKAAREMNAKQIERKLERFIKKADDFIARSKG